MMDMSDPVIGFAANLLPMALEGQYRRDGVTPAHVHGLRVGEILTEWAAPSYVVAAGILHDLLEDAPRDRLRDYISDVSNFDRRLMPLLYWVTDPDGWPRWAKLNWAIERYLHAPNWAKLIKLADILDNTRDINIEQEIKKDKGDWARLWLNEKLRLLPYLHSPQREEVVNTVQTTLQALGKVRW